MATPVHVTLYEEIDKPEAITWIMMMIYVSTLSVLVWELSKQVTFCRLL